MTTINKKPFYRVPAKVLHLNLYARYFDAIANGEKREEYRALTPFWERRIENRHYDIIVFRNGYRKNAPTMLVEYCGWRIGKSDSDKACYVLVLGRVLAIDRNPGAT